jgi:hypothetical protein
MATLWHWTLTTSWCQWRVGTSSSTLMPSSAVARPLSEQPGVREGGATAAPDALQLPLRLLIRFDS